MNDVERIKNYIIERLTKERKQLPSIQKNWYCYALKDVLGFIGTLEKEKEIEK